MNYLLDFILSFLATLGFAIIFEIRRQNLIYVSFVGAIGWIVYIFSLNYYGLFISSLFSSISIVLLSRIMAKYKKAPALIFYIPGIFPIVPGAGIYNTAYAVVNGDFGQASMYAMATIKTACAIVLAVALASLIPYSSKKKPMKYLSK